MSIQYILGNSGSGKTHYIYSQVRKLAEENPNETFYVVVPEQFTMQTQRRLVLDSKHNCILNIDVVSFDRLAYRVFDELGIQQISVLDDIGKSLLLQRVIQGCREDLKIFKYNVEKPGYIDQIKSLISEFEQYQVLTSELKDQVDFQSNPILNAKVEDMILIYERFHEFMKDQYITNEELLHYFSRNIERSNKLKNATFIFEGYTGFTPVQSEVVEQLAKISKRILVTVLIDIEDDYMKIGEKHQLFYMSRKFIRQLHDISERSKIRIEDPVILNNQNGRFSESEDLGFLEQNIFRNKREKRHGNKDHIKIIQFKDPKEEADYVAAMIEKMVREKEDRYGDYAVVTGDLQTYGELMKSSFENLGIPCYIDEKKKLSFNVGMEFVKGVLEMISTSYSYESVFRVLKTGFGDFNRREIEQLENFCIKYRIYSRGKWMKSWLDYSKEENIASLEAMRLVFLNKMEPFIKRMLIKNQTVKNKTVLLYEFLVEVQLEKKLADMADEFQVKELYVKEKEYRQSYKKIMEVLEKMVDLLGEEILSNEDYSQILNAAFDTTKVGTIPAGNDYVLLGDVQRTRFENIKTLFFIGVNEGIVPKATTGSICFNQQERELLENKEIHLAPSAVERMFMQQFYLYMVLTKPSSQMFLTYPTIGLSGKSMSPSYLLSQIKKLFPDLIIEHPDIYSDYQMLYTKRQAFHVLAVCMGEENSQDCNHSKKLLQWFMTQKDWENPVEKLISSSDFKYLGDKLNKELSNQLYGDVIINSVSRLESFEKCPCMHFLKYGLRLKERETGDFKQLDLGNALHEALERFGQLSKQMEQSFAQLNEDEQRKVVDQIVDTTLSGMNTEFLLENPRQEYDIHRMKRLVNRTVRTIAREMEETKFVPTYFEVPFQRIQQQIKTEINKNKRQIDLFGKIDRIDIREENGSIDYRVVDYKSGTHSLDYSSVYYGLQLQLAVYAHFAQQLLIEKYPDKKIHSKGVYYYKIDDPLIKVKDQISVEELETKILKELEMVGESQEETVEIMKRHALKKIVESQTRILDGDIQIHPVLHKGEAGCDYCEYHGICKFDPKIDGFSYRHLKKLDPDEAIHKMEEE